MPEDVVNQDQNPNGGGQTPEPVITFPSMEAFAARMDREARSRLQKIAAELGFASVDELKAAAKEAMEAKQAAKSELEKAQERIKALEQERDQVMAQAQQAMLAAEVARLSAKLGIVDPDAALALMDRSGIEFKDGKVHGVEEALTDLLKAKPYLKANTAPVQGGGDFSAGAPAQKSLEQLIAEAEKAGNWAEAIRLKGEWLRQKRQKG